MDFFKGSRLFIGIISLVLLIGIVWGAWHFWGGGPEAPAPVAKPGEEKPQEEDDFAAADPEYVIIGGVRRKATDVRPSSGELEGGAGAAERAAAPSDVGGTQAGQNPFDYGKTPPVATDANPQVASVVRRIGARDRESDAYHRAVSAMARPEAFDAKRYRQDEAHRRAYLENPEPGRVFVPAQPGKDVPRLQGVSPYFQRITQGDSVTLRVRGVPGSPVTFTSFDLGRFQNQLTTITVEASEQGIAEAEFTAPPGTIEDANILTASPMTSGQVKFVVNTQLPDSG